MIFSRSKKKDPPKIGDFVFFTVFICLGVFFIVALGTYPLTRLSFDLSRLLPFLAGLVFGSVAAHFLIRAHLSVLIHELKHMILSISAGNRAIGLRIARREGHFEYEYSEETKSYNAFISLAPYFLPIFSIITVVISILLVNGHPREAFALIGIAYGMDLVTSLRDVSPHQSDFSSLRGGFLIGFLYVLFFQGLFAMCLITWIGSGLSGLELMFGTMLSTLSGYVPLGLQGKI